MSNDKQTDDDLLREIRERWDYHVEAWRDIREEGRKDVRCAAGNPWDDKEREARENPASPDQKRPVLAFDELQQYINQSCNEVRINKRAVKISPDGDGADDDTAELRQNRIREIEYRSNAQSAYTTAFEDMITRSYGAVRITTEYCDEDSFDQELKIKRVPNPDSVSFDPDAKEADYSDGLDAFVVDYIPRSTFKRRYPNAKIQDFTSEHMLQAPRWIMDQNVQVAEYWKVHLTQRKLLRVGLPDGTQATVYEDEIRGRDGTQIFDERPVEERKIVQYITNGLEILDRTEWKGKWIPLVPFLGKEMYVDNGSGPKRILLSLIRFAREPYMMYCAIRSNQAEYAAMLPKVVYMGYEGQFATETQWKMINKIPMAYVEVKPTIDVLPNTLLPLPQLAQKEASAIVVLDNLAESLRRSIQAAMGQSPLPTTAQRQNEKSGVALQKIESSYQKGSFHFLDNYDRALYRVGCILNDLLDKTEVGPRTVGTRKADDTYEMVKINQPAEDGKEVGYGDGKHNVTVSSGPSFESQRLEASTFLDTMIANLNMVPAPPEIKAKLLSLSIKLKNIGPIGDQMSKLLDPQEGKNDQVPPQVQAQMNQAMQMIHELTQQVNQLMQEREAKVLELQSKERIAATQAEVDKLKVQTQAAIGLAELQSNEGIAILQQNMNRLELMIEQLNSNRAMDIQEQSQAQQQVDQSQGGVQ